MHAMVSYFCPFDVLKRKEKKTYPQKKKVPNHDMQNVTIYLTYKFSTCYYNISKRQSTEKDSDISARLVLLGGSVRLSTCEALVASVSGASGGSRGGRWRASSIRPWPDLKVRIWSVETFRPDYTTCARSAPVSHCG